MKCKKIKTQPSVPSTQYLRAGVEFTPFYLVDRLGDGTKDLRNIGSPVDYVVF